MHVSITEIRVVQVCLSEPGRAEGRAPQVPGFEGRAPQVRMSALARHWGARTGYAYDQAYARWRREAEDWQARRFLGAADILGVSPADVTPGDLLYLAIAGQIPGEDTMPRIRVDGRYGPRTHAQLATRAARQAARKADLASGEAGPGRQSNR